MQHQSVPPAIAGGSAVAQSVPPAIAGGSAQCFIRSPATARPDGSSRSRLLSLHFVHSTSASCFPCQPTGYMERPIAQLLVDLALRLLSVRCTSLAVFLAETTQ